ncbi:MAG: HAD family hydrolase [Candidatus Cryptobacteroides sp.]
MKAVIFDIDGTLYRMSHFPIRLILADPLHISMLSHERKCRKMLQGRLFPSEEAYYDELFSLMSGGSPKKALKCRLWFWDRYMPLQVRIIGQSMEPRKGVAKVVKALKESGCKVAVLSDYGMAVQKLAACGIDATIFDKVWESPSLGGLKPCREVFLRACAELGAAPGEVIMVGDKVSTDGGAQDAGLRFIHIIENEQSNRKRDPCAMTWGNFAVAAVSGKLF